MTEIDTHTLPKARVLPKKAERISTGIRLPVEFMAQLDDMIARDPLRPSRGRLIELAVAEFLERRSKSSPRP